MHTTYVLYSDKFDKIYVGQSSNLPQRFISHNEKGKKGWTIKFRPWRIIHTEEYDTKREAIVRERNLKSGKGRDWIRKQFLS